MIIHIISHCLEPIQTDFESDLIDTPIRATKSDNQSFKERKKKKNHKMMSCNCPQVKTLAFSLHLCLRLASFSFRFCAFFSPQLMKPIKRRFIGFCMSIEANRFELNRNRSECQNAKATLNVVEIYCEVRVRVRVSAGAKTKFDRSRNGMNFESRKWQLIVNNVTTTAN